MPKISPDKSQIYGAVANNDRLTFRERLMQRFASHEWVRVINIDDEPLYWQYLPIHAEEYEFTPDPMRIVRRGEVEPYILNPGESEVLIGENAYVMIEALYKKVVSKKTVADNPTSDKVAPRHFNWTDGQLQEKLINRIFLGKESPTFGEKSSEIPRTPQLTGTLGKSGRIRKQKD